jgi:hypothetical protein
MKDRKDAQDERQNMSSNQNADTRHISNVQTRENDNKGQEENGHGKKKIMDRVRRGYPDGPGGSYDGF